MSLAFNAGVLFTLACTNGGDAVSAVAETVGAAIRAIDVAFDDTAAQLGSATAQGAIDALDTRVDALDGSEGGLGARLTAAEAAVAALTAQLEALTDQPKLQSALDALPARGFRGLRMLETGQEQFIREHLLGVDGQRDLFSVAS